MGCGLPTPGVRVTRPKLSTKDTENCQNRRGSVSCGACCYCFSFFPPVLPMMSEQKRKKCGLRLYGVLALRPYISLVTPLLSLSIACRISPLVWMYIIAVYFWFILKHWAIPSISQLWVLPPSLSFPRNSPEALGISWEQGVCGMVLGYIQVGPYLCSLFVTSGPDSAGYKMYSFPLCDRLLVGLLHLMM